MHPFETLGEDGRVYMHYDNWTAFRERWIWENPCPEGQYRYDLELVSPRARLDDVPIDDVVLRPPRRYYYECDEWHIRLGPFDAHHPSGESLRIVVESGLRDGCDYITLLSTSSLIPDKMYDISRPHKFVFLQNRYWLVKWSQFLQPWRVGGPYPLFSPPRPSMIHRALDRWLLAELGVRLRFDGAAKECVRGKLYFYYGCDGSLPTDSVRCSAMAGIRNVVCIAVGPPSGAMPSSALELIELCDPRCFDKLHRFAEEWLPRIT